MQSPLKWLLSNLRNNLLGILVSPAMAACVVVVTALGLTLNYMEKSERQAQLSEDLQVVERVAVLLEQNVYRLVNELDRILLFIRQARERSGYTAEWADLINNKFTVHDQVVLISVVDRNGILLTSTMDRVPKTRVDLSDRPHINYHVFSDLDGIYISKPILGRVSGKKTVQFTRRIVDAKGDFDGVLVASLDPTLFIKSVSSSVPGNKGGFSVLHSDRTVLAGLGALDMKRSDELPVSAGAYRSGGTAVYGSSNAHGRFTAAERSVADYPLSVAVVGQDTDVSAARDRVRSHRRTIFVMLSLTLMIGSIISATIAVCRREQIGYLANFDPLTGLANRAQFSTLFAKHLGAVSARRVPGATFARSGRLQANK